MILSLSYILGYATGSAIYSAFGPLNVVAIAYFVSRQCISDAYLLPLFLIISILWLFTSVFAASVNIFGAFSCSSVLAWFSASLCGPPSIELYDNKSHMSVVEYSLVRMLRKHTSTALSECFARIIAHMVSHTVRSVVRNRAYARKHLPTFGEKSNERRGAHTYLHSHNIPS